MSRRNIQTKSLSQSQVEKNSQVEVQQNVNIDDEVNNLVRYFVNRAGEHVLFKRPELKKNVVPKAGQYFQQIFDKAANILKEVYGYSLIVTDPTQNALKSYIVSNALPYILDPTETILPDEYPEDVNKILTILILSHIFMSNNSVTDNSLYSFLSTFGIDIERKHEIFGSVKDFITTLKNKKYINIEVDQMSKKMSFSWGPRAEKEISKHEVLKFVCKMYKSTMPSSWISQYKAANEQDIDNEENLNALQQATQISQG